MKARTKFITCLVAAGALSLSAYVVAAGAGDVAKTCDGKEADIVAEDDTKVVDGTSADDLVVLVDGVRYSSNGGTDTLCNAKGEVEATLVSDDAGPEDPDPPELPNMVTLEEMENGELPGEWRAE